MSGSRPLLALLAGAAALGLTACQGSAAERGEAAEADFAAADTVVVAEDVAFVDPPTSLAAGTHILGIDNQGEARHDLAIEGDIGLVAVADGGDQAAGEVTLEPGDYTVYCSVPGHRSAGMAFDLTVG